MATNRLGRYEILGELGRGAMGVVYRARDPIIDRVVALKTINLALTGAALASFEARFFQEARSAGRLNHPNIVTIYDAGKADGRRVHRDGVPRGDRRLREILDEQPPLSIPRILETVAQVARGLAYAHENGVVHRDIKPANIIVLRNRRPKITDFGIARLGEADGVGSERAGSPKYMSPEQIRGDVTLDGRSDVFSLGDGALRDAHRQAAVRRRDGDRDHAGRARAHPAGAERGRCARAAGARRRRDADAREAARRPLSERTQPLPRAAASRRELQRPGRAGARRPARASRRGPSRRGSSRRGRRRRSSRPGRAGALVAAAPGPRSARATRRSSSAPARSGARRGGASPRSARSPPRSR